MSHAPTTVVQEKQQKLVSIVLTTLNGARYLRESLDSCLGQSYQNIELLLVDGGSTDGTLDIVATYTDPRMRVIHQENNAGKLPGAINLGLTNARGEYLTWMQDDCIYDPRAIEIMVEALESHPKAGQVYADYWIIDADGGVTGTQQTLEPEEFLTAKGDPAGVCFLIRRSVRDAVGPHDITAYPTQDADYRWRIAMRFQSFHIREPLYYWRLHPYSLTGSWATWLLQARNDIRIRLKLGIISARQARLDYAEFNIAFAFEQYQAGRLEQVPGLVLSGLWRDPRYALNRGVWAMLVRSLLARSLSRRTAHA
jgi:glycosyltransferase involved in cell wall biosynthesis